MELLLPDSLTRFIAQVVVIIAASRLVGLGTRWIRQPMVIAEITAGILLGPSLLGWLAPELSAGLFEASSLGVLKIVLASSEIQSERFSPFSGDIVVARSLKVT